jgi:hypothetical protein
MKKTFWTFVSILSACLVLIVSCAKAPNNVNASKLIQVEGQVSLIKNGNVSKAGLGTVVTTDDQIKTGSDSRAKIQIGDGAVVCVEANSSVKVRDLFKDPVTGQEKTKVEFQSGKSMLSITKKLSAQDTFDVMTPSAVAGVRGTEFLVDAEDPAASKIAVTKGAVVVRKRIAALDDAPVGTTQSPEIKEALKQLAESQEVPLAVNQEFAVSKKEADKVNEIVNQVVVAASQKIADSSKDPNAAADLKKSIAATVLSETKKNIETSIKNKELEAPVAPKPISEETKKSVSQIQIIAPYSGEDLKSLKATVTEPVKATEAKSSEKADVAAAVVEGTFNLEGAVEKSETVLVSTSGKEFKIQSGKNSVPVGTYTLKSEAPGYRPIQTSVSVTEGKPSSLKLEMKKRVVASTKILMLDGTTILGKITSQNDKEVTIETEAGLQTVSLKKIDEIKPIKN